VGELAWVVAPDVGHPAWLKDKESLKQVSHSLLFTQGWMHGPTSRYRSPPRTPASASIGSFCVV